MVETPRLRFMLHIFSYEGYSRAEVFFQVQDMIQWGWKLEGSRMLPTVIDIEPVPGNLYLNI